MSDSLEEFLYSSSKRFVESKIDSISNSEKQRIFATEYDTLNSSDKKAKALILLAEFGQKRDSTKLEEAAIILDNLSKKSKEPQIYEALTFVHALAGRYSEAHDALGKTEQLDGHLEEYESLDKLLTKRNEQGRKAAKALDFKPSQSFIINYKTDKKAALTKLLRKENVEVIAVVDDINFLPEIRDSFNDSLYTIETESKIHEVFNPINNSRLRVILKNNDNDISEKSINLGIRKAKQDSPEKLFSVIDKDKYHNLSKHISATPNLAKIIRPKKTANIAFFGTTKENTHGVPVVMNNIAEQLLRSPGYVVSFITNNFDNNEITFTDVDGKEIKFKNREEFSRFVKDKGIKIDVLHSHSWHLSDFYKPFHTNRDDLSLDSLLRKLGSPKFIFTDHSNPTEDLRKLNLHHPQVDYLSLTESDKGSFLYGKLLDNVAEWEKGWEATSILSKRQIMDFADWVSFVSKTQMLEEEENIPHYRFQDKAQVVMNGVDIGKYNNPETHRKAKELRQELGIKHSDKVVLYAGRMDEEKGIYDLAEATKAMSDSGENVTIIYLGSNGSSNYAQAKIKGISPNVKTLFLPKIGRDQREKMAAMYAMANVVAQPTWGECFNQIVAEALSMGTPAVVSNFSAPGEIYVQNGAALGSKVQDPRDLADKLLNLLNDREVYEKIKRTGLKLVETELNVESMGRNYMKLYEAILRR